MRLILTLLLCMLMAAGASAETALFTQGAPHRSQPDYRQYFETMTAQTGLCTVSIKKAAYEQELAERLYGQIASDEMALSALGQSQPHTVYVVDKLIVGTQRIGSSVYCTAEQVLDGSYRPWVAEAAFGVERWQGAGLAGYVFGAEADESALAQWYQAEEHDDMLSLFHAYFVPEFSGDEARRIAEQTAVSLVEYIIAREGVQAAMTAKTAEYAQSWLASLGVDRAYVDPYAGLLDGYTYSRSQYYAMIATSPKGDVFKLNPIAFDMSTPAQVRKTLCEVEMGADAILAGVERDAPDCYPVLLRNYEAPITYEFKDGDGYSLTYHAQRRVEIGRAAAVIHETAHMMTPCPVWRISRDMDQWKAEAIAEYLALTYYPGLGMQELAWRYMQDADSAADAEQRACQEKLWEVYCRYMPMPESPAEINMKLYWRSEIVALQELEEAQRSVSDVYAGAGSATLNEANGNELSYAEGEWLASWLINRHGLSAFLSYCLNEDVSFRDAFGMAYEDAKAEWLASRSLLD